MPYRIVRRRAGKPVEYLAHVGHDHYWTPDVSLAMEYSKLQVAKDLCLAKTGTAVEDLKGNAVWRNE